MTNGPWSILPILMRDYRVTVAHLAVYLALCDLWQMHGKDNTVIISRRWVMHLAKIRSYTTYHKHIQDLQLWNYITYLPSYSPGKKTQVVFNDTLSEHK